MPLSHDGDESRATDKSPLNGEFDTEDAAEEGNEREGASEPEGDLSRNTAEPDAVASVAFMITRQMVLDLLALGYSQEEINRLTPQQAHDVLHSSN